MRFLVTILALILSPGLGLAQTTPNLTMEEADLYRAEIADLDRHPAGDEDVWMALGRHTQVPSYSEMRAWLNEYAEGSPKVWAEVHGIELRRQPQVFVDLFEALTTDRNPDTQEHFTVERQCGQFDCALDAVFGNQIGIPLAYMLARFGYNGSHFSGYGIVGSANSDPYTWDELEDVLIALGDLPPSWRQYAGGHPLVRFSRGMTLTVYALEGNRVVGNGTISLFDPWEEQNSPQRQQTVFHEVAHRVSAQIGTNGSNLWLCSGEEWKALSGGWGKKNFPRHPRPPYLYMELLLPSDPCTMVSDYAFESSSEDFAESAVAYRYRPDFLLQRSPEKYQFLKDRVFGGIEYRPFQVYADALWRYRELTARDRYMMDLDEDGDVDLDDASAYIQTRELREPPVDCDPNRAPVLVRESDLRYATPSEYLSSLLTEAKDYRADRLIGKSHSLEEEERRRYLRYYLGLILNLEAATKGARESGVIDKATAISFLKDAEILDAFLCIEDRKLIEASLPSRR